MNGLMRVGMGYDVHKLTEGRKLILGGVDIPWEKGLLGHSDADVLIHAIMDALLGAAALGDIGKHFPDTDPAKEMYSRYASECNVNGRPMLPQTMEFITDMGTIFQSCMKDEISVDEFCEKAQGLVEKYSK